MRPQVPQRRHGRDVDARGQRVELGAQQAGVDGADDEVFEGADGRDRQRRLQVRVVERGRGGGEREESELAEFVNLCW